MKINILILFLAFFFNSCLGINTTDPQVSDGIKDSKKSGFFVKSYHLNKKQSVDVEVKEAWVENVWFYKIINGKVIKQAINKYQFCFLIQKGNDTLSIGLMEGENGKYVGNFGGTYVLYIVNFPNENDIKILLKDMSKVIRGVLVFNANKDYGQHHFF